MAYTGRSDVACDGYAQSVSASEYQSTDELVTPPAPIAIPQADNDSILVVNLMAASSSSLSCADTPGCEYVKVPICDDENVRPDNDVDEEVDIVIDRERNCVPVLVIIDQYDAKNGNDGVCAKVKNVGTVVGLIISLLVLLYLFVCSLDLLSSAFRLLGGKAAGGAMSDNKLMQNPVAGLMIGILATVLVQSSSTSTSIVVTMVASGIFDVRPAIPIVMGANIGTSLTNTLVSMAHSGQRGEFRRAFAGATVHDMFNWLSVLVLLPLEVVSGYLYRLTSFIVTSGSLKNLKGSKQQFLKVLTKPLTNCIVKLDKHVIEMIATQEKGYEDAHILKKWCKYSTTTQLQNDTESDSHFTYFNESSVLNVTVKVGVEPCHALLNMTGLGDSVAGATLLVVALIMLCSCLVLMVKTLNRLLNNSVSKIVNKTLNADFPGKLSWLTGYVAIVIGALMTVLVQSSSIFTSALTPLVGIGVISLERMYPLTLGSNIGTTATGLVAALASDGDKMTAAIQIALCHLFFNISGILLFYPVPIMRNLPIRAAKLLGKTTAKYRWFAILYLFLMFFALPGIVLVLSLAGFVPFICVSIPVMCILVSVITVNILQHKRPEWLPKRLQSWQFLPEWMHSLAPLDNLICYFIKLVRGVCPCWCRRKTKSKQKTSCDSSFSNVGLLNSSIASSNESTPSNTRPSSRAPSTICLNSSNSKL